MWVEITSPDEILNAPLQTDSFLFLEEFGVAEETIESFLNLVQDSRRILFRGVCPSAPSQQESPWHFGELHLFTHSLDFFHPPLKISVFEEHIELLLSDIFIKSSKEFSQQYSFPLSNGSIFSWICLTPLISTEPQDWWSGQAITLARILAEYMCSVCVQDRCSGSGEQSNIHTKVSWNYWSRDCSTCYIKHAVDKFAQ